MSTQRLSINIDDATAAALQRCAARRQTSITATLGHAVEVFEYVHDANERGEDMVIVDHAAQTEQRVVIL